jgi:hypothetical protein
MTSSTALEGSQRRRYELLLLDLELEQYPPQPLACLALYRTTSTQHLALSPHAGSPRPCPSIPLRWFFGRFPCRRHQTKQHHLRHTMDGLVKRNSLLRTSNPQVVLELDRHIVGQADAKRAIAIAMRNRWRRKQYRRPPKVAPATWRSSVHWMRQDRK